VLPAHPGHNLQPDQLLLGAPPPVAFHVTDHHVRTAAAPTLRLAQHGVRLAHTRCGTEVDPQHTAHACHWLPPLPIRLPLCLSNAEPAGTPAMYTGLICLSGQPIRAAYQTRINSGGSR